MPTLYAVSPSPILALDHPVYSQVQTSLTMLGEYIADARAAVEFYEEQGREHALIKAAMRGDSFTWAAHHRASKIQRRLCMYAREFVFALDYFHKELSKLRADPTVGEFADVQLVALSNRVPAVVAMRDSLHHQEDRIRGMAKKKEIVPQAAAVSAGAVEIVGPGASCFFVGINIAGRKIVCTTADGAHTTIEFTVDTISEFVQALQGLIDALPWDANFPPNTGRKFPDLGE